jgi:hypothetical protein
MTVLTEGRHNGEGLLSEANGTRSRENVTFLTGSVYVPGQVLGKITASGKYTGHDPAAEDGSESAAAICYAHVDASAADAKGVIIARDAEWNAATLTWITGISGPNKTAGTTALAALGILLR